MAYSYPACNGKIIFGYEFPDELLFYIFQNLPDKCLLKVIPYVCNHWHSLSRSWHLWKIRLRTRGINISKLRLERISSSWEDPKVVASIQWLCLYEDRKGFNHNLLKNPSGAQKFAYWKVQHGGDGVIVEEPPVGSEPIPSKASLPTQHCFVSSFNKCKRTQVITLCKDFGVQPFLLDVLRPTLCISEWMSARWDCGAVSMNQVTVVGKDNKTASFINRWQDADFERVAWHRVEKKVDYQDLPENMSTIRFSNVSRDTQFWAGHYGAKTAGSSVLLDIANDHTIP